MSLNRISVWKGRIKCKIRDALNAAAAKTFSLKVLIKYQAIPEASKKKWSVYIVRCKDNSLYTGISNDVDERFATHQAQGQKCAKYLRGRAPLELVFVTVIGSMSEASKLEWEIKQYSMEEKEALISSESDR